MARMGVQQILERGRNNVLIFGEEIKEKMHQSPIVVEHWNMEEEKGVGKDDLKRGRKRQKWLEDHFIETSIKMKLKMKRELKPKQIKDQIVYKLHLFFSKMKEVKEAKHKINYIRY